MSGQVLTGEQTHALLDILTHHETYAEIEAFKLPDAVTSYGYPFKRTTELPPPTWSSRTMTPTGSAPTTPRARTPVLLFWGREDKVDANDNDYDDDDDNNNDDDDDDDDDDDEVKESTSPVLQMLLRKLVLPFPGVKNLPRGFWSMKMQGLLVRFAEAGLSESYDKGALGVRKMLATAASSVLEMLARGALGGIEEARPARGLRGSYDVGDARELERAWSDCVQEWAHGGLLDDMLDRLAQTDDVEGHSPAVAAVADYIIIHLATFLHQIFIVSPKGQYLVRLIEGTDGLIPYKMMKQTLRVGNAATMINGMVRLLLAKLSVASLTNWFGLTANADDGMNMLQRIIWAVLSLDGSDFRRTAERIEGSFSSYASYSSYSYFSSRAEVDGDRPGEEVLRAIREHVGETRGGHDTVRAASVERSQSIIAAILEKNEEEKNKEEGNKEEGKKNKEEEKKKNKEEGKKNKEEEKKNKEEEIKNKEEEKKKKEEGKKEKKEEKKNKEEEKKNKEEEKKTPLTKAQHARCLEYYSALLAVRDRESIVSVLCRQSPDLFTQAVRDVVAAFDPMIRSVHSRVDLRSHLEALQTFVADFIQASQPEQGTTTVQDYVRLLRNNKGSLYRWVHAVARGCPEVWRELRAWSKGVAGEFRQQTQQTSMNRRLGELFASLDAGAQEEVLAVVDRHARYLADIKARSRRRLQDVVGGGVARGPGAYVERWQDLLDATALTAEEERGGPRRGGGHGTSETLGKLESGGLDNQEPERDKEKDKERDVVQAPDVAVVVDALGDEFRRLVRERMA